MNLLIPKLSPVQWFLYSAALLVCWVFRGDSETEVLYAVDPVTLPDRDWETTNSSKSPRQV